MDGDKKSSFPKVAVPIMALVILELSMIYFLLVCPFVTNNNRYLTGIPQLYQWLQVVSIQKRDARVRPYETHEFVVVDYFLKFRPIAKTSSTQAS